ncbi:MAG: cyclic pyranopterin monophosphate synthase MoaC [Nitrospinae bacterium]|nr:cyclic pyranopterin monophosphate synthase MoaC [Nitrospinota bacterium]
MASKKQLTHINSKGEAHMVDVSAKKPTRRRALAGAFIKMSAGTIAALKEKRVPKGDVFAAARVAGIMAAKKTADIIPLCHPLGLDACEVRFNWTDGGVEIFAEAGVFGVTGVEMEALTAVSVAALTIYDMCKSMDKRMKIGDICLLEKDGGKSGPFRR